MNIIESIKKWMADSNYLASTKAIPNHLNKKVEGVIPAGFYEINKIAWSELTLKKYTENNLYCTCEKSLFGKSIDRKEKISLCEDCKRLLENIKYVYKIPKTVISQEIIDKNEDNEWKNKCIRCGVEHAGQTSCYDCFSIIEKENENARKGMCSYCCKETTNPNLCDECVDKVREKYGLDPIGYSSIENSKKYWNNPAHERINMKPCEICKKLTDNNFYCDECVNMPINEMQNKQKEHDMTDYKMEEIPEKIAEKTYKSEDFMNDFIRYADFHPNSFNITSADYHFFIFINLNGITKVTIELRLYNPARIAKDQPFKLLWELRLKSTADSEKEIILIYPDFENKKYENIWKYIHEEFTKIKEMNEKMLKNVEEDVLNAMNSIYGIRIKP